VEKTVLKSIFKHIRKYANRTNSIPLAGIKSPDELQIIINRERCRVNRNSHAFSLAVFKVNMTSYNGEVAQSLAEILSRRLRLTDDAGWLDDEHIAVVLDYTWAEGAWKFASDISELVSEKMNLSDQSDRIEYRVYTYSSTVPAEKEPRDEDDDDQYGGKTNNRDGDKVGVNHSRDRVNKRFGEDDDINTLSLATQSSDRQSVEGIEAILAKKIPIYKRGVDIFGALFGIMLLTPLFIVTSLLITIVSPGPIFFKQERIGYLGKKFKMWKFRTMRVNADQSEHKEYLASLIKSGSEGTSDNGQSMHKLKNDKRVIPLGNFIRKTAIDELPQLFNVLKGDMSLIGPRPPIPYEVEEYHRWHYGRFDAVPGMTGLWQVSGKNRTTFKEMIRYDIAYGRNMSLRLDARILAGTIPAIVTQIKDTI